AGGAGGRTYFCSPDAIRCAPAFGGIPGNGGAGIAAPGNTTVTLSGSLAGGNRGALTGQGTIQPNTAVVGDALDFSGSGNKLILENGFSVTNNVVAHSGDTLALGGDTATTGDGSFDVTQIGASAQYRGFGSFQKIGSSIWTLSGANTGAGPWTVQAGELAVAGSVGATSVATGATLSGIGTVSSISNSSGTVAPGSIATPYAALAVSGNATLAAAGTLTSRTSVGNLCAALNVGGTLTLGGKLHIAFDSTPTIGATCTVATASSISGTFAQIDSAPAAGTVQYNPPRVVFTVLGIVTPPVTQCSGAPSSPLAFDDTFPGNALDPSKWTANGGGTIAVANNSVSLSGSPFPYVTAVGSPIPASGSFSVRWSAMYDAQQPAGTGSLALAQTLPALGQTSWST